MLSRAILFVTLLVIFAGCKRADDSPSRLVGHWQTAEFSSQLGRAQSEYWFCADGSFRASFVSQGSGKMTRTGTCSVEANELVTKGATKAHRERLGWKRDSLVLTDAGGESFEYQKVSTSCE